MRATAIETCHGSKKSCECMDKAGEQVTESVAGEQQTTDVTCKANEPLLFGRARPNRHDEAVCHENDGHEKDKNMTEFKFNQVGMCQTPSGEGPTL